MKRVIDVNPKLNEKIDELIQNKEYKGFQHFADVALENQVLWETEEEGSVESSGSSSKIASKNMSSNHWTVLSTIPKGEIMTLDTPSNDNLVGRILWGQYYRFLSAKFAVRILANMSTSDLPELRKYVDQTVDAALSLRQKLVGIDKKEKKNFGERLSASFPTRSDKSMKRFALQYIIYVRSGDYKLDGFLPRLKLVNITDKNDENLQIGLTKFGREFATMRNPILDENGSMSLSNEEIEFLLNHIADNLPEEAEHMQYALKTISSGTSTREDLNKEMRRYYRKYDESAPWSDAVVNTMRAGLLSRMFDLDLLKREKTGKNVRYSLSERGNKFLNEFSVRKDVEEKVA